jgi:hypothetical protein
MSLNVKGQLKEAQAENLAADPANLPHGRFWYDTVLNKLRASLNGVAKSLVTDDGTATLTNKTIVAASNTVTTAASGNLAATELNAALAELDGQDTTNASAISAHIADGTDAHAASAITNTPAGNLSATTVQAALNELQGDIDTLATGAALTAHESDTSTHGVGEIVGRTEVQTLTNKTLTSPVINSPTGIVKGDVGLGNVDNTSDATKNAAAATLTNKTIDNTNTLSIKDTLFTLQDDGDANKQMRFQLSGITTGNARILTVPDTDITVAGRANSETLQNKTLDNSNIVTLRDDRFTLQDSADTTKQAKFELSSISSGQTKTYTLPDINSTVAVLQQAQTFSAAQTFSSTTQFNNTATFASVVALSGGNLQFPAIQVSSADANTLDDYEEGTFTPITSGGTSAGTGTYSTQNGWYTKIGQMVYFSLRVQTTAHTGTGDVRIGGLPFTSQNVAVGNAGFCSVLLDSYSLTAGHVVTAAYIIPNDTKLTMYSVATGGGATANVAIDAACTIMISGFYKT